MRRIGLALGLALDPVVLQEGLDVTVPESSPGQLLLALLGLVLFAIGLAVAQQQASSAGLPESNREHRTVVRTDYHEQTPAILQYPSRQVSDGIADLETQVDALLDRAGGTGEGGQDTGHVAARSAASNAYSALAGAWGQRVAGVPAAVLTALEWALVVALFGSLATATGAVVAWLSTSPDYPTLGEFVQEAGREAQTILEVGRDVAATFPFAGFLWNIAFVATYTTAEWIYAHWYALVAVLLASASAVWYLDRRLRAADVDVPRQLVGHPRLTIASAVVVLIATWATGTAIAAASNLVGLSGTVATVVDAVGFLAAIGVLGYLGGRGLRAGIWRVRQGLERRSGEWATLVGASLLLQRVIRVAGGVAGLLVATYVLVGVTDGSFGQVARAYADADPGVQLTVALAVLLVVGALGWALRDAWPDVRAALAPVVSQRSFRARMIVTGLPLLGVAGGYVLVWLFTRRVAAALVGAVVIGLLLRSAGRLFDRAVVATDWRDLVESIVGRQAPRWVTWRGYVLEDDDGTAHYLIEVDDERVAATDRDRVVAAAVRAGREIAASEEPTAIESAAADALLNQAIVDDDEVRTKQREQIRKTAFTVLRTYGPEVDRDRWDRRLEKYPEDLREQRLAELRPYIRIDEERVVLRRDPYAGRTERASSEVPSLSD
jgi:hypothetical protein